MSDTTINDARTDQPVFRVVSQDGATYILDARDKRRVYRIDGDIGGGGVQFMSTAQRLAQIPAQGVLIYDTTDERMYVGDGHTRGGLLVSSGGAGEIPSILAMGDWTDEMEDVYDMGEWTQE